MWTREIFFSQLHCLVCRVENDSQIAPMLWVRMPTRVALFIVLSVVELFAVALHVTS